MQAEEPSDQNGDEKLAEDRLGRREGARDRVERHHGAVAERADGHQAEVAEAVGGPGADGGQRLAMDHEGSRDAHRDHLVEVTPGQCDQEMDRHCAIEGVDRDVGLREHFARNEGGHVEEDRGDDEGCREGDLEQGTAQAEVRDEWLDHEQRAPGR